MNKQLVLPMDISPTYTHEDFIIASCNIEAYKAIVSDVKWPFNRLIIIGESGSGKTHLANIWANKRSVIFLNNNPGYELNETRNVVMENIENLEETFLFHTINFCHERNLKLLMTTSRYGMYKTPDLLSRITSSYKILIGIPDRDIIEALLTKSLLEKQIIFHTDVPKYIATRIERSFFELKTLIQKIDELSLSEKRAITIPFIKEIFEL
ncbi:Chromosomal replication initiator DnaA-like protein [Candidatus Cyrtobacter comes]|uniref:Chromosomal replication initiator DnaA-like protein n=1 Tax=Candidatus Cyrtobacter comes TaxID=675776 RepID=A0ABU5L8L1_9RICK|nr:DnaA/Hda family protein [Candidatus Cyrtobacter comes]MDZ5762454.1 Chromosomal replication initiator DnaA-like protein [Candidatus Cyrtobacter comes]